MLVITVGYDCSVFDRKLYHPAKPRCDKWHFQWFVYLNRREKTGLYKGFGGKWKMRIDSFTPKSQAFPQFFPFALYFITCAVFLVKLMFTLFKREK